MVAIRSDREVNDDEPRHLLRTAALGCPAGPGSAHRRPLDRLQGIIFLFSNTTSTMTVVVNVTIYWPIVELLLYMNLIV